MQLKSVVNSFLILSSFVFVSCTDDSNSIPPDDFQIESYNALYAHFPVTLYENPASDNLVRFVYDGNNRIVKKTGDVFYTSPNSGSGGFLSDSLFTDLDYYDNKVRLTKGISHMGYTIYANEAIVTFDSNNRMVNKTRSIEISPGLFTKDTTVYTYSDNRLTHFKMTSNQITGEGFDIRSFAASLIYYTGANVDSIVTVHSRKYSDTPYIELVWKEIEIFDDYDSAPNPFRKLQIFEETFTRSLSANNYRRYKKLDQDYQYPDYDYYQSPIIHPAQQRSLRTWSLMYDSNGAWIYN